MPDASGRIEALCLDTVGDLRLDCYYNRRPALIPTFFRGASTSMFMRSEHQSRYQPPDILMSLHEGTISGGTGTHMAL